MELAATLQMIEAGLVVEFETIVTFVRRLFWWNFDLVIVVVERRLFAKRRFLVSSFDALAFGWKWNSNLPLFELNILSFYSD